MNNGQFMPLVGTQSAMKNEKLSVFLNYSIASIFAKANIIRFSECYCFSNNDAILQLKVEDFFPSLLIVNCTL